jgi:hypothetical protein
VSDSPTNRVTINLLSIETLDEMLAGIRERRLTRVRKLEEIAKVKADDARLSDYLRYEKEYERVKKMIAKLEAEESKIDTAMHKLRILVMSMDMAA